MQTRLATTFRMAAAGILMAIACSCGCSKAEDGPEGEELPAAVSRLIEEKKYQQALPLAERLVAKTEDKYGADHQETGITALRLAGIYFRLKRYDEAESTYRRALQIVEAIPGSNGRRAVLTTLDRLAIVLKATHRSEEVISLYQRSLEIREDLYGKDARETLSVVDDLGGLYYEMRRYPEAEQQRLRLQRMVEKIYGTTNAKTAVTYRLLGRLYYRMDRLGEAEEALEQALTIFDAVLDGNHPEIASTLDILATVFKQRGNYTKSESTYRRALEIVEEKLGDEHEFTVRIQGNLANLLRSAERYDEAEELYRWVLDRQIEQFGESGLRTAKTYCHLATILRHSKHLDESEALYLKALKIQTDKVGVNSPDTILTSTNLATLYSEMGRYPEAEQLFEKVLQIQHQRAGYDDRDVTQTLFNLALLHFDSGDKDKALELVRRRAAAMKNMVGDMLLYSGESDRLHFMDDQSFYSLPASLESAPDIAESVLLAKGLVLESLVEERHLARKLGGEDLLNEARAQLREARNRLQTEQLRRSASDEGEAIVETLNEEIASIEKKLAAHAASNSNLRGSSSFKVSEVAAALGDEAALLEYLAYGRYLGESKWEMTYGVVVIRSDREPEFVICDSFEAINAQVALYQKAVQGMTDEETLRKSCASLHRSLLAPVEPLLEGIETIVISPDGPLNFVSFAVLLDTEEHFLSETYAVRYVGSGRELLREREVSVAGPAVLVGGPAFSEFDADLLADGTPADHSKPVLRGVSDSLASIELFPLPAAAREAQRVSEILDQNDQPADLFQGSDATEAVLRAVRSPRVLHMATHGFFLEEMQPEAYTKNINGTAMSELNESIPLAPRKRASVIGPMYRSGIALSGASDTIKAWQRGEISDQRNDGIVMAAEVSELNLRGTDLVVLSACNSGSGDAAAYDGVLGLRRGFSMAGARHLIVALWEVDDQLCSDFMEEFYLRYAASGNAADSFTATQRLWLNNLLKDHGLEAAVGKAGAFIVSGWSGSH